MAEMGPQPPPGHQTYAGDDRAERHGQADIVGHLSDTGFLTPVIKAARHLQADANADEAAQQQAAGLQQGMQTRTGPAMPGTYYLGYEHPAMKAMVEDVGPGQVDEAGAAYNSLGNTLIDFQAAVRAAIGSSTEDWSGEAGDRAREYMGRLGDWMGTTGQAAQLAGNRMSVQAQASERARNSMPEPVAFSMEDAMSMLENERNPANLPTVMSQIYQRFDEKQQAHQQAAETMTTFAQSLGESGGGMPAFGSAPAMAGASGSSDGAGPVVPGGGGIPGGGSVPGGGHTPGGGSTPGGPTIQSGPSGPQPGGRAPDPVNPPGTGVPPGRDGTSSQGYRPDPNVPDGRDFARQTGFGNVPTNSYGNQAGTPPLVGFGPGGGPGAGDGRGAGGGTRGFGPTGGPGQPGPGGRAGMGMPGNAAAEAAGGRGGPAGTGKAGGGSGMGGAPLGGRGKGEDDHEHQRPAYLVEPDPDALFGTDERTAPPVIG